MKTKILLVGVIALLLGTWLTGLLENIMSGDTEMYLKMLAGYISLGIGGYIVKWGLEHD